MGFKVLTPQSFDEALELIKGNTGEKIPISGGTDILVDLHHGRINPKFLLNLSEIREYHEIKIEDDVLEIGGLVTHKELATSLALRGQFSALQEAAKVVGGPQIRSRGTVAGNLQSGSPAADTSPPLLALGARISLASTEGVREVELSEFFLGPKKTILKPNELISKITIKANNSIKSVFYKVGKRNSLAISVVNLAACMELDTEGKCTSVGIALGSVAPTPKRARSVEAYLLGKKIDSYTINSAKEILDNDISPISDVRANDRFRRQVAKNLLFKALNKLL